MDCKYTKKHFWLESILKELYKKVDPGEPVEKPKIYPKKPVRSIPVFHFNGENRCQKRKGGKNSRKAPSSSRKNKKQSKKNSKEEELTKEEDLKKNGEQFWNFVDEYYQSKSFQPKYRSSFINSINIPPTVKYSLLKSLGYLKEEMNSIDEKLRKTQEQILVEKLSFKIQKSRMKNATDEIAREVLEEMSC